MQRSHPGASGCAIARPEIDQCGDARHVGEPQPGRLHRTPKLDPVIDHIVAEIEPERRAANGATTQQPKPVLDRKITLEAGAATATDRCPQLSGQRLEIADLDRQLDGLRVTRRCHCRLVEAERQGPVAGEPRAQLVQAEPAGTIRERERAREAPKARR